ncbi:MAG TPA: type I phosphomannose isomerase catalytic subunit [Gemmataceae bacterium]|jgi:mannose-6-phosphate isomerase|nr:type I phosphomannose isomerase catalytic subunit [Gemmataceae bacterium]
MSKPALYPLRFEPIFKPAIWGGRKLAEMFPNAPAEGPIGEAWLLSDQGENVSVVADGPLKGTTLRELMRDRREELLGPSLARHETFPLLLKIIDARENLSVQVHPDDRLAGRLAGAPRGKSEAWIVMNAEPGSRIFAGLKPGVDRLRLEAAIAKGTVADCLHSFEPVAGDCIYLQAGTIHALGGGITVFEVQQTCDITYRLFDWDRVDATTGNPRDLHIEKALACTNFTIGPVNPVVSGERNIPPQPIGGAPILNVWTTTLLRRPYFGLEQCTVTKGPFRHALTGLFVAVEGTATIECGDWRAVIRPFDAVLVPARARGSIELNGRFTFLKVMPA